MVPFERNIDSLPDFLNFCLLGRHLFRGKQEGLTVLGQSTQEEIEAKKRQVPSDLQDPLKNGVWFLDGVVLQSTRT